MKTVLRLPVVAISILIGMIQPMKSGAQSQTWATTINALSGRQAISSQAASFQKFGSYPVNKATGIPDVSIPIYTIQSGSLELPITLSYHMGGIKVEEIPSWVGLGWNLSAGGVITRTIRGIPDEASRGWLQNLSYPLNKSDGVANGSLYKDYADLKAKNGFMNAVRYHTELIDGDTDSASDIYTYSIGGLSGKFVYDFNRNMVQIPYSDNKIERSGNNFTITDDKGVRYIFKADLIYTEQGEAPTVRSNRAPVTWLLAEVVSADGLDTIKFNYAQTPTIIHDEIHRKSVIYGTYWDSNLSGAKILGEYQEVGYQDYLDGEERLLTSIEFKGERIDFTTTSRTDMRTKRLSEMLVQSNDGKKLKQIKRVVFNHNYFVSSGGTSKYYQRLKLTGISVYGQEYSTAQTYAFDYNTTTLPPYYNISGSSMAFRSQDYWGYYNGSSSSSNPMIPSEVLQGTNLSGRGVNRNSNESAMKASVLTKITYPTGGYTLFETEANRAPGIFTGTETAVGGLRIKAIKSYTSSGDTNPLIVSYTYENGRLLYTPDRSLWKINISFSAGTRAGVPWDANLYYLNPLGAFDPAFDSPLAPGTIYLEDPISPLGQYHGSAVIYGKVTEIQGGSTAPAGKTEYEYDTPRYSIRYLSGIYTGMDHDQSAIPMNWANGQLKRMTMYRKEGSSYVKIKEIENNYAIQTADVCHGVMITSRAVYQGLVGGTKTTPADDNGRFAAAHYHHYWVTENTGAYRLTSTTEKEFSSASDTSGTGIRTTYAYDDTSTSRTKYLPAQITMDALPGNTRLRQTDYAYAYKNYSAMATKNMLDYPYEERVRGSSGSYIFQSRITYTGTTPKPYQVFKTHSSTIPTTDPDLTIVQRNDYGQVLESRDRNGISTVYLWSYKGQYLVAEIVNATYTQVSSALGSSSPSTILTSATLTETHISALKALRTSLPNAQVTVYTHQLLVGVTQITDPSGRETNYTYYQYDPLNRLYETKDHKKNLIQRYQYNMTAY